MSRLGYSEALRTWDVDGILANLSHDIVIHVAVHPAPLPGREVAEFLFDVLRDSLVEPEITDEIVEGERAVVLFDTAVAGTPAQGLNVVRLDGGGLVREVVVFFRPLEALQVIAEVVGPRMAARFGPPG